MAWKIERWLSEVFPGQGKIYSEYSQLPERELAIVAAAVLDVALAELLSMRLRAFDKEVEEFLGLNGDGRAPAGSFGARIQLGLLVGVLTDKDALVLRTLKDIRNQFAHRVKVTFTSPPVVKLTRKLHAKWVEDARSLAGDGSEPWQKALDIGEALETHPGAGRGLVLAELSVYQAYFHRIHGRIERLGDSLKPKEHMLADLLLAGTPKRQGGA